MLTLKTGTPTKRHWYGDNVHVTFMQGPQHELHERHGLSQHEEEHGQEHVVEAHGDRCTHCLEHVAWCMKNP